ncbi:L polymerase [Loveridge's garter snake virus 1]|uniref:RNA-directed RNA polymerase n=1 Tax=Loveridge's garter snake virus 1 TaxID=1881951 RepID=A0A077EMR8_9MONO|nr:L polymerase [Loveridge's garter snake virus 1]AIL50416.1 L polymerase [Loveridge's garter snake virus 1]
MSFHARLNQPEEAPGPVVVINRADQTLKNPLIGTEVSFCLESRFLNHHRRALQLIKPINLESKYYYKLFRLIKLKPEAYPVGVIIRAAESILTIVVKTWHLESMTETLLAAVRYALTNPRVRALFDNHMTFQRIIREVSYSRDSDVGPVSIGQLTIYFIQSLIVIHWNEQSCIATYNHFLAAADTAKSRCHLAISAVVSGAIRAGGPFLDIIFAMIDTIDAIVTEHDDYFNIVKSIYPYTQGLVMEEHNETVESNFCAIFTMIPEKAPGLDNLLKKLVKKDPRLALEIASVQKSWFFPEIDMVNGPREQLTKMRNEVETGPSLLNYGNKILSVFRAEFIKGFIAKNSKWPPVVLEPGCPTQIRTAKELNNWSSAFDINWHWFRYVSIQKVFELDTDPDFNDIVTDKAVIESRASWPFEFNSAAHRHKHKKPLDRPTGGKGVSRLVNALIDGKLDNIPKLLEPYMVGSVDIRDRITILVPKEKELKVKGRFFSKQSLNTRVYQVISEATLKRDIMPLIRTHSMTMGSTALTHLLNKLSHKMKTKEAFVINLDYSSWCNAFRPELQMPICRELDSIYDSSYFFRTGCMLPCYTTFIVQNRFNPPLQSEMGDPIEDGVTCIQGALTPGEGMRQKLWTIITGCWEMIALREAAVQFDILGQGDNQTIIIYSSTIESNQCLATRALGSLYKHARLAGHTLKVEECWISDCLYEYGKRMYFHGIPISGALKQLSRVTDSTGEIFPNLYSKLACLISSCLSAAMSDTSPWISLTAGTILYLVELYIELPPTTMQQEDIIVILALVGPILGGLPTPAMLPSVFFRGMSDPLPLQLALLKEALNSTNVSLSLINRVVKLKISSSTDWLALVTDPTSLNISQLLRPERQLRRWVEQAINQSTHSSRVADFFRQPLTELAQMLAYDLSTMIPLRPRDMSALFGLSNVSYGLGIIDLFQKSSTVISANQTVHLEDIVLESKRYKMSVVERLQDKSEGIDMGPFLEGCTYLASKRLRALTWGRELVGVTMPFVSEQFRPVKSKDATTSSYKDAIIYCPEEPLTPAHLDKKGKQPLYLGSNTSVKVQKGEITGLNKSRAAGLVRDTLVLCEWYKVRKINDPNLSLLLKRFLTEKGYNQTQSLSVQGGTLTHRLPSRGDSRQGLTGFINIISTWLRFTSDYLTTYSKSVDDYTIHFQHVFTYGCLYADSVLRSSGHIQEPFLLEAACSSCFERITSEEFVLASSPMYQGAPWLLRKTIALDNPVQPGVCDLDPCVAAASSIGQLVVRSLISETRYVRSSITEHKTAFNLERFSLADLKTIPWSVTVQSAWLYLMSIKLSHFEKKSLVGLIFKPDSPTRKFLTKALGDSSMITQIIPIVRGLSVIYHRNRGELLMKIILMPLINLDVVAMAVGKMSRVYSEIDYTNVDFYIARSREVARKPSFVVNETNDFTATGFHTGKWSLASSEISMEIQAIKMGLRKEEITRIWVYPEIDPSVPLDICHLPGIRVFLILAGDPDYYERILDMDMCGAAASRIDVVQSLALSSHFGYHLGGPEDSALITVEEVDKCVRSHHCLGLDPPKLVIGNSEICLDGMCCLPLGDPCPALYPPMYRDAVKFSNALLNAYEFLIDLIDISSPVVAEALEELDKLVQVAQSNCKLPTKLVVTYWLAPQLRRPAILVGSAPRGWRRFVVSGRLPSFLFAFWGDDASIMDVVIDQLPAELVKIIIS